MDEEKQAPLNRSAAQFFFEIGFAACWAEVLVRNGYKRPFPLTDEVIERAWAVAGEAHDDHEEFDRYFASATAAPELLEALENLLAHPGTHHRGCIYWETVGCDCELGEVANAARAAIRKAKGTPHV